MKLICLVPLCVIAVAPPASADTAGQIVDLAGRAANKIESTIGDLDIERTVVERIARAAIGRVRRGIAIGPLIGAFEQISAKDSATGFGMSFGLGLYTFEIPTGLRLKEVIIERVKKELRERALTGDLRQVLQDIIDKVIHDVLEGAHGSQTLQRPKLSIILEGQNTFGDADGFGVRLYVGFGFSKLSVGVSSAVGHASDKTSGLFGPELALRLTPIGEKRTPVFDVFARFEITARSGTPMSVSLGMRVLLDVL